MQNLKKRKPLLSYFSKNKESLKGWLFLVPVLYGLIYFFIIPVFKSFLFSIGDVTTSPEGYKIALSGFSAYNEALNVHTSYRQDVVSTFIEVITTTPLIVIYSFFIASILNQEFRGRTFFRVVFFLPIVVIAITDAGNTLENSMGAFSSFKNTFSSDTVSVTAQITDTLINFGVSEDLANSLTTVADKIYGVISLSSVQILILLVSMQSIAPALYEAAVVEGATSWESFWKITFPMISPMLFTCVIYTVVDSFTRDDNAVMTLINDTAFSANPDFSLASAMGWIYFAMIAVLLGVVAFLFSRLVFFYDN